MKLPPLFLGGCGRSGTTLVADLMGMHPDLSPIYETDFVPALTQLLFGRPELNTKQRSAQIFRFMSLWSQDLPRLPSNKAEHERYFHGPHHIRFDSMEAMDATMNVISQLTHPQPALRQMIVRLFAAHCHADGKASWINKTPRYCVMLGALQRLFPDMRYLHCVRNPLDVINSARGRPWFKHQSLDAMAEYWTRRNAPFLQFAEQHPGSVLVVPYENLICEPAAQLTRIFDWLGMPASGDQIVAQYNEAGHSFDPSRIGQWTERLGRDDAAWLSRACGPIAQALGYPDDLGMALTSYRRDRALAATASGVKPNFSCRTLAGADAPNRSIPTVAPRSPIQRSHPWVTPASTETRGTPDPSTLLR